MSKIELPYQPKYVYVETEEAAKKALEELTRYNVLAVDTETTGLDPYNSALLLLQIATQDVCYILNCVKVDPSVWAPILSSRDILKLLHNAAFDYKMIKVHAGAEMYPIFDTMVAEQLIVAGRRLRVGLEPTVSRHLGIALDKGIRSDFIGVKRSEFTEDELIYAANDALILHELYRRQVPILQKEELMRVAELEFNTVIPVAEMELEGVLIDVVTWRKLVKTAAGYKRALEAKLREIFLPVASRISIFGDTAINFSSQKVLLEHLNKLGITCDGKPIEDTSDETLKNIDHPIGSLLREWRKWEKVCSAYGDTLLNKVNPKTGRLHASYNQLRAATGRMSSSDPNAQQIPGYSPDDPSSLNFRGCFIAKPGYKLVTADYSQQELRILAALSGDKSFIEAYRNNEDLHTRTAINVFGGTPEEVKLNGNRKIAKTINFLLSYGGSAFTLSRRLGIPEQEAQKLMDDYFNAFPGVKKYMETAADFAVRNGYSVTVSGRRRYFDVPSTSHPDYNKIIGAIRRKGMNTPIQGCLTSDARVLTINGYKSIGDLVSCSSIDRPPLVWTGEAWERYDVLYMGKWRRASIEMDDGTIIQCDTRHKVLGVFNDGYKWVDFDDIKEGMRVAASLPTEHVCFTGKKKDVFFDTLIPFDLPLSLSEEQEKWWWVGVHKAVGEINEDGRIIYIFGQDEAALKDRCVSFWSSLGKTSVNVTDDSGVIVVVVGNNTITEMVNDGVFSADALNPLFFSLSPESKAEFISGFFSAYKPAYSFLSYELLYDIKLLARSVGYSYRLLGHPHYMLVPYTEEEYIPGFIIDMIKEAIDGIDGAYINYLRRITDGDYVDASFLRWLLNSANVSIDTPIYTYRRVKKITIYDEEVETYTLAVDADSHRFDCEGIITKNSAADVSKQALCNIYYRIKEKGLDASVLMIVHDELVCEAAEGQAEEVARLLEESMIDGFTAFFKNVPVVVDACIDDTWHH